MWSCTVMNYNCLSSVTRYNLSGGLTVRKKGVIVSSSNVMQM